MERTTQDCTCWCLYCLCESMRTCPQTHRCTVYVRLKGGGGWMCVYVCVSGDGRKLFEQDVLTQCVQRDILPHIQTDGANLETDREGHLLPAQRDNKLWKLHSAHK